MEVAKRRDNKGLLELEDQEDQKIVAQRLSAMRELFEIFEKLHDKDLEGVYFNIQIVND